MNIDKVKLLCEKLCHLSREMINILAYCDGNNDSFGVSNEPTIFLLF